MSRAIETIRTRGLTIDIYQDEDATSPEEWGNDDLFLSYDCRRVGAGRKGYARDGARYLGDYHVYVLDVNDGPYTILSLGATLAPLAEDDEEEVNHKGYVYVSRAEWPDEDGARKAAVSLVEEWNTYLSGDVYGYVIRDEDGADLDSCWGFYGMDTVKEEARSAATSHADTRDEEQARDLLNDNDPRCHLATVPTDADATGEDA
jgi:hypothetical protein